MSRVSVKPNKPYYQIRREELKLSRAEAAKRLSGISEDRIEGIENGRINPTPEDILQFADAYKDPLICNSFCSKQCGIGKKYVPSVEAKDLPSIVLGVVATLNNVNTMKDRLIAIAEDGKVSDEEWSDLDAIDAQLERLSLAVESLQLWVEKTRANKDL